MGRALSTVDKKVDKKFGIGERLKLYRQIGENGESFEHCGQEGGNWGET